MIKLKISFFTLGLVSGLLAGYFLAQWQYRLSVLRAGSLCNQSATTTNCLTLLNQLKSGATPPPEQPKTILFAFGPLTNTYEDKEFGFSLKYPDELQMYPPTAAECRLLNDKMTDGGNFAVGICNQKMVSSFRNPLAHSLDDYRQDYFLTQKDFELFTRGAPDPLTFSDTTKMRVHIKKNEDITTLSGTRGLKQIYTVEYFDANSNISIQERPEQTIDRQRYIFYQPQKGTMTLWIPNRTNFAASALEDAIIQSISY